MEDYSEFFFRITRGHNWPLPYQRELHRDPARYTAVSVPTGLGKTDAVLVDWLARRPTTRLVWCLPGRALTKQIADNARQRVAATGQKIGVLELMGGQEDNERRLGPDEPAILVGTQDILISRALNRGYARSPFWWPMDFALLNNDAQWVFDEVQLLGDALATSAQLAAFREEMMTFGEVACVWMSATFDLSWLETVNFKGQPVRRIGLGPEDLKEEIVQKRIGARKDVQRAPEECRLPRGCAEFVAEQHRPGTLTLVIANTVTRAREIWSELKEFDPILLHSRFRPEDRARQLQQVLAGRTGIVVSTQVIEAGVDLDADLMVTDVAPWASLVQRFGRVNRYGEKLQGRIFWVDRPLTSKRKGVARAGELKPKEEEEVAAPYEVGEIREATEIVTGLTSASPGALPEVAARAPYEFVLRRTDLLDLFDTTPDLAGNQIDVSRFVRSGKEHDVYVAWRSWDDRVAHPRRPRLDNSELCPVPLGKELKDFLKKHGGWVWRHSSRGAWVAADPDAIYPGMRILVRCRAGGYGEETGWDPGVTRPVISLMRDAEEEEAHNGDFDRPGPRQALSEHTDAVVAAVRGLIAHLTGVGVEKYSSALETAARKHDWGKAHPVFQQTLHGLPTEPAAPPAEILGKSGSGNRVHSRQWFRHELASALAMLDEGDSDLAAYLAAAHHGKVRLNIRSMPGEVETAKKRVARGVWDGDPLFAVDLGDGCLVPSVTLALWVTELGLGEGGARGWTDRVLDLLAAEGPFRLAFLEMVMRAADERASKTAQAGLQEV